MAKVRVHALAKELDIQSKDIIGFLTEKKIEVKSAQSSIEDDVITMVKDKFGKKNQMANTASEKKEDKTIQNTVQNTIPNAAQPASKEAAPAGQESKPELKAEERPKKKSSITAVFNPQNSKMGTRRPADGQRDRSPQQRQQGQRPAGQRTEGNRPAGQRNDGSRMDTNRSDASRNDTNRSDASRQDGARPVQRRNDGVRQDGARPAQGQRDNRQDRPYQGRGSGTGQPQGRSDANRQDGTRPAGQRNDYNRNTSYNRPASDRPGTQRQDTDRRQDRPVQRSDGQRTDNNRPSSQRPAARTGNDRGGRNENERGNNRNYQNNRPGGTRYQGDKNNQRVGGNHPKEQKSRLEQEISKLNQTAAPASTEEPRSKESRENRRGNNQKQVKPKDFGVKKQERYTNLEKNGGKKRRQQQPAPAFVEKVEEVIKTIILPDSLTIKELADKMKVQASAIVKKLFLQGTMVTVNQEVEFEKAEEIALEYNCICEREIKVDVIEELLKEEEEDTSKMVKRPPVVCVMGHVDHGKTSLLDAIRDTHVIDREAGGITQHIGAYMVTCNGEKITFLDTPGHEAFTAMRMRGANATDIAILVVAADDGVMPQTIEAISHAKAAGVEIIVAINKVDKPSANIERVKQELSEYELIPEDWGGSTIFVPVSAHTHEGIDNLLEMILLTAEVAELKANPKRLARGLVIEAQLDKGRGAVATVLVQKGTLKVGQPIAAGSCSGKVRAMIDDKGRRVKEAGPSTPVEILGLNSVPNAGEVFVSTDSEKEAKSFADTFISQGREKLLEDTKAKMSLDDLFTQIQSGNVKELGIIVKADVQGSVEAVKQSLTKLSNEEVVVKIVHGGVGAINESDVSLASASNAIIIGFNVRPDVQAKATAEREGVDLRLYRVIYNAIEDVQAAMNGMLDPVFEEKIMGHAEVRQIFKASGIGNIAGSYVLDGMFQRGCKVRITREGEQIFDGNLASLKRFKDDVKEVKTGYECGLVFEGFNDILELDIVEAYTMVEVPR